MREPQTRTKYSYDQASQLTAINYTLGASMLGNLTYAYDFAGRRTAVGGSFARTGLPQAVSAATYNANNQLTQWKGANLAYDANGNLISDGTNTYTWNARNQLVLIRGGVAASLQYDAFGRRVSKTIVGTTQYLYDGANPIQELSGGAPSANLLAGGVDEYFQYADPAGPSTLLTDALGSTIALISPAGSTLAQYTYDPFGNTTSSGPASTNTFQYTGRENDGTGLYFYRARYYNPSFQRFVSEDPARFGGGANFYVYGGNDPVDATDPSGNLLKWDHHDITYQAAIDAGWTPEDAEKLAQAVVNVDNLPGAHIAQGDLDGLSKALHIIQDSNSPSHMGWQPWDGGSTIYAPNGPGVPSVPLIEHVPTVQHMLGDLFPGAVNRSVALAMSTSLLREAARASHGGDPINPASYFPSNPCGSH